MRRRGIQRAADRQRRLAPRMAQDRERAGQRDGRAAECSAGQTVAHSVPFPGRPFHRKFGLMAGRFRCVKRFARQSPMQRHRCVSSIRGQRQCGLQSPKAPQALRPIHRHQPTQALPSPANARRSILGLKLTRLPRPLRQPPLVRLRQQRAREQQREIDQRHHRVDLQRPVRVRRDQCPVIQQVRHRDGRNQRRVLQLRDRLVDERRDHPPHRLRQYHPPHHRPPPLAPAPARRPTAPARSR